MIIVMDTTEYSIPGAIAEVECGEGNANGAEAYQSNIVLGR